MVKLPKNMYIVKMTTGERLKIPKEVCDRMTLSEGDYLFLKVQGQGKMSLVDPKNGFEEITASLDEKIGKNLPEDTDSLYEQHETDEKPYDK